MKSHYLQGLYIPGGCLGILPSTVSLFSNISLKKHLSPGDPCFALKVHQKTQIRWEGKVAQSLIDSYSVEIPKIRQFLHPFGWFLGFFIFPSYENLRCCCFFCRSKELRICEEMWDAPKSPKFPKATAMKHLSSTELTYPLPVGTFVEMIFQTSRLVGYASSFQTEGKFSAKTPCHPGDSLPKELLDCEN